MEVSLSSLQANFTQALKNVKNNQNTANDAKTNAQQAQDTQGQAKTEETRQSEVKTAAEATKTATEAAKAASAAALEAATATEVQATTNYENITNQYNTALDILSDAQRLPEDTDEQKAVKQQRIATAQAAADSLKASWDAAKKALQEATEAKNAAKKADDEAKVADETAGNALELANSDYQAALEALNKANEALDTAVKELDTAETELTEAIEEAEKAEKAKETAEEAIDKMVDELPHMSAEQAQNLGYTPITTTNPEELQKLLSENPNGKFCLMNDINLDGYNWQPIGTEDSPFTGKFHGNNYQIKNMTIDASSNPKAKNLGFFGVTDGADIDSLFLTNAKIINTENGIASNSGLLIGKASNTHLKDINVTGSVNGHKAVGGVVGLVDDTTGDSSFDNVTADVNIEGKYFVGGIIGRVTGKGGNLKVTNCSSYGNSIIDKEGGGGIIGRVDKRVVTVDHCSSSMNLKLNTVPPNRYDEGYVGGIVGLIDGAYIAIANCDFDGTIDGDITYESPYNRIGGYRYDAHVSIYDVVEGLPADDILKIALADGLEGVTTVLDANGNPTIRVTINTIGGMDALVDLIRKNLELADSLDINYSYDFMQMIQNYDFTEYKQYGIFELVTGSREDPENPVQRNVYFDNEVDAYNEFHGYGGGGVLVPNKMCDCVLSKLYHPTFVEGLYYDDDGIFYVEVDGEMIELKNFKRDENLTLEENIAIAKRLSEEQIKAREEICDMGHQYQDEMYAALREQYGLSDEDTIPIIDEAEYDELKWLLENDPDSLTDEQRLGMAKYDIDKGVGLSEMEHTDNQGCGMGGQAPYADSSDDHPVDKDGFEQDMEGLLKSVQNGDYNKDKYTKEKEDI